MLNKLSTWTTFKQKLNRNHQIDQNTALLLQLGIHNIISDAFR